MSLKRCFAAAGLVGMAWGAAAQAIPEPLAAMVQAERAFARMASDATPRDAFIEFFADESVSFIPEPGAARTRLRNNPSAFPPDLQLLWEPRVGDVSSAGDLGYLTGPYESSLPGQPARFGSYFSIWKRQIDGTYRVLIDMGVGLPEKAAFGAGFVRSGARARDTINAAGNTLMDADRAFAHALATTDPAAAYGATLHAEGRVHRPGSPLMATREAAVDWMRGQVKGMTSAVMKAEEAASHDLGYSWGAYEVTPPDGPASRGYYVRVWTRAADGRWQLAADVTEPTPP